MHAGTVPLYQTKQDDKKEDSETESETIEEVSLESLDKHEETAGDQFEYYTMDDGVHITKYIGEGTDNICVYDRDKGDYLPVFKGINKTENGENKYYMESPDYPDGTECSESEYNSLLKSYTDNCTNSAYCEKSTENLLKDIEEY